MPSNRQLLTCIRTAVKQAAASSDPAEQQTLLGAADLVLNELQLRDDPEFSLEHYDEGKRLAVEGLELLGSDERATDIQKILASLPDSLTVGTTADEIGMQAERLSEVLQAMVARFPASGTSADAFLDRVCAWEVEAYAHRLQEAAGPDSGVVSEQRITRESFENYLRKKFPDRADIQVTNFAPLPGGFSKNTILVDTNDRKYGDQSLVIRAQQSTMMLELPVGQIVDEYPILRLAHASGVQLPEPLWLEDDPSLLGACFVVSRRAYGENVGTAIGATAEITTPMVRSLAEELVKIHTINLGEHADRIDKTVLREWQQCATAQASTRRWVQVWRDMARKSGADTSPLMERAFQWLENNIEDCDDAPVFIHGDYGPHNILIDDEKVSAILDWEVARLGDPAEDVAWLLACTDEYVGRDQLLQAYRDAGGKPLSEFRLRYFDVLNCIKMPIACLAGLKVLDRRLDNIQYAVFGLRFIHHNTSRLVESIERAEAVRC